MSRRERLFRVIGLAADDLIMAADRPVRRRNWKWAACLAVLCALGAGWIGSLRMGGGMDSSGNSSGGAGGGGHDEGTVFMAYAGPVFPMTALEEGLTAERTVTWDFAPGAYADGSPRQWGAAVTDSYTLFNPTEEDMTVRLLYPFAGSFLELAQELPSVLIDGTEAQAALYAGPYSGGFRSAGEEREDTLNLQNLDSWTQYQALLEDGRYQAQALDDYAALDLPVIVYRFSEFEAPQEQYQAATQAVSFPIDDDVTQVLTYGFNGYDRADENGLRRYSYFVPDGVTRETELKLLIVLGEDLASYTLQGYQDGGCDPDEEIEGVSCAVTREISTLAAVLEEACRDFQTRHSGRDLSDRFTLGMHLRAASELLTQYGLLSDDVKDRYDTGQLDDIVSEAVSQERVMYLMVSVKIPAGGSVAVEARLWKAPSFDFYCGHTVNQGIQGYDLVTQLGSNLLFTQQTAALENTQTIEIVRQNFGFDPEAGITSVTLNPEEPHYYLEIRPTAE